MLRGILHVTALAVSVCSLAACTSSTPPSGPATTAVDQPLAAECRHGGKPAPTEVVSLLGYDASTQVLVVAPASGDAVRTTFTAGTTDSLADIEAFPPDPIDPKCVGDAGAWNAAVWSGSARQLTLAVAALAGDGCNASIGLAPDGSLASFQPVP